MTLKAFFKPDSVAVIGASPNPSKLGHAVLKNIVEGGYGHHGKIHPINPGAGEILGYPAYREHSKVVGKKLQKKEPSC